MMPHDGLPRQEEGWSQPHSGCMLVLPQSQAALPRCHAVSAPQGPMETERQVHWEPQVPGNCVGGHTGVLASSQGPK